MAFNALRFSFDGMSSEQLGLYILSIGVSNGASNGMGDIEIIKDSVLRKSKPYFFGVSQGKNVLTFDLTFGALEPLNRQKISLIQKHFFGRMDYGKLRIIQSDMADVYFNCFLKNPQITFYGNLPYVFKATVECDSPFAWEKEKEKNLTGVFYNSSDDCDYMYPTLEFEVVSSGDVSILNLTDDNYLFSFTGLTGGEKITIDNYIQDIKSSLGLNRLPNFNKGWFRLLQGRNDLTISSNMKNVKVKFQNARKMGG